MGSLWVALLMAKIILDVPDDIVPQLTSAWGDVSRGVMMAIAAVGYRSGALSREQVGRLLGL